MNLFILNSLQILRWGHLYNSRLDSVQHSGHCISHCRVKVEDLGLKMLNLKCIV